MFYVIVNWIPRCILDLVIWCFGIQYCWYFGSPVHYSPHCVDDDYCVAIHDLSPVLTALFSFELGGFNSQHIRCWKCYQSTHAVGSCCRQSTQGCCRQSTHSLLEVVAVSQHSGCCRQSTQPVEEVNSLFYVQSQKRLICDDPVWFGALVRADVL